MMRRAAILACVLLLAAGVSAQGDLPPYIYYPVDGGYVIERADGTHSRILMAGSSDGVRAVDPHWSPSGRWLAWRETSDGGCSAESGAESVVIAGAGVNARWTNENVVFSWLAPVDRLLIVYTPAAAQGDADRADWQIIDPAAPQTALASGVLTAGIEFTALDERRQTQADAGPAISPDGRLTAFVDEGPVIVDRESGTELRVPPTTLSFMGNLGGRVEWHPTENWLISEEAGPAYCASTSFTQVTDGTYRREIEACGSRANCVRWLPEHVDPSQFPPYERPSEPRPYAVLNAGDWVHAVVWSADGATLFTYGEPEPIAAFNVSTREIDLMVDFPHPPDRINGSFQDYPVLAESANYAATLAGLFDKRTGEVVLTYADDIWVAGGRFAIGADERFMISAGMTQPLRVWSLEEMRLVYEGLTTTAAALGPDGATVAVAAGWEVRLYDLSALVD